MKNKTVIISGASSGLGLEIAKKFAGSNYKVIGFARRPINSIENGSAIFAKYASIDVNDQNFSMKICKLIGNEWPNVVGLINNIGKSSWRSIVKVDEKFLDEMFSLNLKQTFMLSRIVVENASNLESIVNIASIAGRRGSANNSVYSAMKFGLIGFTQSLSKELGAKGVRVNSVSPVLVETNGLSEAIEDFDAPANSIGKKVFFENFAATQSSLLRLPEAQEVSNAVEFLISESASAITGQNLNVDCGVFPQ